VALAQVGQAGIAADLEVEVELHAAIDQQLGAAGHHLLLELEVGDAVDEQTTDAVVAVVDMDLVALAAQLLRRGEAGRAGADDANGGRELLARARRLDPAAVPGGVGDELLDRADGDGAVARLLDDAVALAEAILGADAAADLREVVGGGGDLIGLLEPALGGELQPVRDVVVDRAMDLAEGHAALRAAARLLRRPRRLIPIEDLLEVAAPERRLALDRHLLPDSDELQHLGRHLLSPTWLSGLAPGIPPAPLSAMTFLLYTRVSIREREGKCP
jgi:hypothetical protein